MIAAETLRQTTEALDAARAQRDEILAAVAAAEDRLARLRERAREQGELGEVRRALTAAGAEIETARGRAEEVHRQAAEAAETFREVAGTIATARVDVEAVRRTVAEAEAAARRARELADGVRADVARGPVEVMTPVPAPAVAERAPTLRSADPLPEVEPVAAHEQAGEARSLLLRYLNDAAAVEREAAGLIQTLADVTDNPPLRGELQDQVARAHEQQACVEERVRALGGEPGGGRGLLGQIVTRIWEAVQHPRSSTPDKIEDLLKAVCAGEFEAGMYRAVHALARALGDEETATLAAAHHRQEQEFAERLRGLIAPTASRLARAVPTGR